MKLLFMKSSLSQLHFVNERQMIKTGLLLSEKFFAVTPTLGGIAVYRNRGTAKDRHIINNYKYYFTNLGNGYTEDELENFLSILTKLRGKKIKSREELINLGQLEKSMKRLESEVNRASVNWLEQYKLDSLVNFN